MIENKLPLVYNHLLDKLNKACMMVGSSYSSGYESITEARLSNLETAVISIIEILEEMMGE